MTSPTDSDTFIDDRLKISGHASMYVQYHSHWPSLKTGPTQAGRSLGLADRWISTFHLKGGAVTFLYIANIVLLFVTF